MDMEVPKDRRVGQILLHEGCIDEVQLKLSLAVQAGQVMYKPLGEVLRELGFITRRHLQEVLVKYRKQIQLGELLVRMGAISESQLAKALEAQKNSRKKLGQVLMEAGVITRAHFVDAVCVQLGIQGMNLAPLTEKELLQRVSPAYLRSRRALPLEYDKDNNVLKVIMEDPSDKATIADLEKVFKTDVEPVMLRADVIDHLLDGVLDIWYLSR